MNTNKYIRFELALRKPKTNIYVVRSRRSGFVLARILWHSPWRQYVLEPEEGTIWNDGCLAAVHDFLAALRANKQFDPEHTDV